MSVGLGEEREGSGKDLLCITCKDHVDQRSRKMPLAAGPPGAEPRPSHDLGDGCNISARLTPLLLDTTFYV